MKVESSLINKLISLFAVMTVIVSSPLISAADAPPVATGIGVESSRIGDASHFEFSGRTDWKYELKRDESGKRVVLRLSGLKSDALTKLKSYKDTIIQGVTIKENGIDGAAEISFGVAKNSDFFDYLTESPPRLIVDFFPNEPDLKPTVKKAPAPKETAKKVAKANGDSDEAGESGDAGSVKDISTAITGLPKKANKGERAPAASDLPLSTVDKNEKPSRAEEISAQKDFSHGIFDGGDPEFRRFTVKDYEINEDSIFKSRGNFYLPFPMLDLGNPQLKALIDAPPTYEIVPNDTRENKEARILLSLYSTGKRALFTKTSTEFLKKYPTSQYDEIVRYLVADLHETMWREEGSTVDFEAAMNSYQSLAEKYPSSPVTPRTLLFLGFSFMERGDSFGALKAFQRFTRLNPTSKYIDQVNIAVAEAYLKLNRYDDAMTMLESIESKAKTSKQREEAAFRKGDVAFRSKDYDGALKTYKATISKYPDVINRFPNAYYNIAEAEFTKGKFREALEDYRVFLQKFPDHDHGGYAMTRMGELIGILGADPKRAQGAFMESSFRYRATPGAGIGRIRMLAARFPEMKEKELASSIKEIAALTEKYSGRQKSDRELASVEPLRLETPKKENLAEKKPVLQGIEEFTALQMADGYNSRGEYDQAAKDLIAYFQKNPQTPNKERIVSRISKNISDGIRASVDKKDFMEALRRYGKDASGWLKNTERVDVKFSVGRAYEEAGVTKEASAAYKECIERLKTFTADKTTREHSVYEKLPALDQVNLRLAAVADKGGKFSEAETSLKAISVVGDLTAHEQIERAEVSADVAEARGQSAAAKKYLTDLIATWKGEPELTSPLHLRIARIQNKEKNFKEADQHLSSIFKMKNEGGKVADTVMASALQLRGEMMVVRGNRPEAIKAYRELIAQYGETRPLASVRYRLGQLLYEDGDLKAAQVAWAELKPDKDGMWAKLANEQMQGAKWQNEYKKYLNRIPAASEIR